MNKKRILLLLITAIIILIIGGADGPTSIFIAGKIGGRDYDNEEKTGEVSKMQVEIKIGDTVMIAELENNAATTDKAYQQLVLYAYWTYYCIGR